MKKKIQVGILGFGTVGSGVLNILKDHSNKIKQVTGGDIVVKKVLVRNLEKPREAVSEGIDLTTNIQDILGDPEINIIVEVMGSIECAKEYISKALIAGKHVVTANKDLIALHGNELVALAKENKCDLYYEASVAGGIPILRTIVDSLASDNIQKVFGIVNGTTNFILSEMTNKNKSYEEALKEAQELGFAEVNGIRNVHLSDIEMAKRLGYRLKLIGSAVETNKSVRVDVGPVLVPEDHPLASVQNENNAVFVVGSAVGETMFYGPGAGALPTATSVVSDVITVAKNIGLGITGTIFNSYQHETLLTEDRIIYSKYYIAIEMQDQTGQFLELTTIFNEEKIGFDQIIQDPLGNGLSKVVIVTHKMNKTQQNAVV